MQALSRSLPQHAPMLHALRLARRLQAWVLLAFACSVGAAVAAPWIVAPAHASVVCTESGGPRLAWDPSPADGRTPAHDLQCPLCLPVGTAPAIDFAAAALDPMPDAVCTRPARGQCIPPSAQRPPARAPPPDSQPFHEVTS